MVDFKEKMSSSDSQIHLLFLHASPIFAEVDRLKTKKKSEALDFCREAKTIKIALTEAYRKINFMSKVATKQNFNETLNMAPKILHISCHGGEREKMLPMGVSY